MLLLCCAVAFAQGKLEEKITGGKAKRLVDRAMPMLDDADAIYKAWVLEEIPAGELKAKLTRGIELYDEATTLLQNALDIQYDAGVNYRSKISARRLQKMRFQVEFVLKPRPKPKPRPAPAERPDEPDEPEPRPAPAPPRNLEDDERPSARVAFEAGAPPARPVDAALPAMPGVGATPEQERLAKRDRRAIKDRISDYFTSFKRNRLLHRHRLCRGKGAFRDGSTCEECNGTGVGINLYHFRKVFWTAYTPLLRDAEGALKALEKFHDVASRKPEVLGPTVKSFKVDEIEYQGLWAKAKVLVNTTEGERERTLTLVSIGSSWFLYHPDTDRELLPEEAFQ